MSAARASQVCQSNVNQSPSWNKDFYLFSLFALNIPTVCISNRVVVAVFFGKTHPGVTAIIVEIFRIPCGLNLFQKKKKYFTDNGHFWNVSCQLKLNGSRKKKHCPTGTKTDQLSDRPMVKKLLFKKKITIIRKLKRKEIKLPLNGTKSSARFISFKLLYW